MHPNDTLGAEFDPDWQPPEHEQFTKRGTNLGYGARLTTIDHLGHPLQSGTQLTSEWLPHPREGNTAPDLTDRDRIREIVRTDPYVLLLGSAGLVRETLIAADAYYRENPLHYATAEPWLRESGMLLDRAVDLLLHRFYRRALCRIVRLQAENQHLSGRRAQQIVYAVRQMMELLVEDVVITPEGRNISSTDDVARNAAPGDYALRAYSAVSALIRGMARFIQILSGSPHDLIQLLLTRAGEVATGTPYISGRRNATRDAINHYWQAIKARYPVMVDPSKGESIACEVLEEDAAVGYDPNDPKWKKREETRQLWEQRSEYRRRMLDMMEDDTTDGPSLSGDSLMSRDHDLRQFLGQLPTPLNPQATERMVKTLSGVDDEDLPVVLGLIQYQADGRTVGISQPAKSNPRFPWLTYDVLPESSKVPTPTPRDLQDQSSVMRAFAPLTPHQRLLAAAIALDMSLSLLQASGKETAVVLEYAKRMKKLALLPLRDGSKGGVHAAELAELAEKIQTDSNRAIDSHVLGFVPEQIVTATLQMLRAWAVANQSPLDGTGKEPLEWQPVWTLTSLQGVEMTADGVGGSDGLARMQTFLRHWWSEVRYALALDTGKAPDGRMLRRPKS